MWQEENNISVWHSLLLILKSTFLYKSAEVHNPANIYRIYGAQQKKYIQLKMIIFTKTTK